MNMSWLSHLLLAVRLVLPFGEGLPADDVVIKS